MLEHVRNIAKIFLSVKGGSQAARWKSQALPSGQGPMHEDHRTQDPCCRRAKDANVPSVVTCGRHRIPVRFHTPNALDSVDLETILDRNNLHNMHQHIVSQIVQTDKALLTQAKLSSDRLQMAPVSFSPPSPCLADQWLLHVSDQTLGQPFDFLLRDVSWQEIRKSKKARYDLTRTSKAAPFGRFGRMEDVGRCWKQAAKWTLSTKTSVDWKPTHVEGLIDPCGERKAEKFCSFLWSPKSLWTL